MLCRSSVHVEGPRVCVLAAGSTARHVSEREGDANPQLWNRLDRGPVELGPGVTAEPCPGDRFMSKMKVVVLSQKFGGWFVTEMRKQTTFLANSARRGGVGIACQGDTRKNVWLVSSLRVPVTCESSLQGSGELGRHQWPEEVRPGNRQEDLSETSRRCCFIYCLGID